MEMETVLEALNANAGLIVAGCALVLTIANMWLLRRHHERSTRPLLLISPEKHVGGDVFSYKLAVRNRGLGPAILKRVEATFAGEPVTLDDLARGKVGRAMPATTTVYPLAKGDAMAPRDERLIFSLSGKMDIRDPNREEINQRLRQVEVTILYESLYGWKAKVRYQGASS